MLYGCFMTEGIKPEYCPPGSMTIIFILSRSPTAIVSHLFAAYGMQCIMHHTSQYTSGRAAADGDVDGQPHDLTSPCVAP